MASRWHYASWGAAASDPCAPRPPEPGPRPARRPLPADAGAHAARLRGHQPRVWAALQDGHHHGEPPSGSGGAHSWHALAASATSTARPGLRLDLAAATASWPALAGVQDAQMPLAELVSWHSLPEVDSALRGDVAVTTMAVLNLPYAYPKWKLQWDIKQEGLAYDYFHCPQDARKERNRGFAFVNFLTPEAAHAFQRSFHNRELSYPGAEAKVVAVVPSDLQGLEKNARLHPQGLALLPQLLLQQYQQRHLRQQHQQMTAASGGGSTSRGPWEAEQVAVDQRASSSRSQVAPATHSPSPSRNVPVVYRLSL
ncbi:unnamed protein product [Prorocentrum cordatum]|uniref:Mei2-like C-terminal RNA recognition motif domain-containing protein n=1 Tax=Prorocentrum cordatum TaxID=2364126 RepID=A0ABN9WTK7_9DINO|nr:unnamed protein product [Polarella glacialis]